MELEHWAYWAAKKLNFNAKPASEKQKLQLNELDENVRLYKERTKQWHDKRILYRVFTLG